MGISRIRRASMVRRVDAGHSEDQALPADPVRRAARRVADRGATLVEYAMLLALLAVVSLGSVAFATGEVEDALERSLNPMGVESTSSSSTPTTTPTPTPTTAPSTPPTTRRCRRRCP